MEVWPALKKKKSEYDQKWNGIISIKNADH